MRRSFYIALVLVLGSVIGFVVDSQLRTQPGGDSIPESVGSSTPHERLEVSPAPRREIANEKLAGRSLFDRYEAVLTLLESADDHDEMFRIFSDCAPDHNLRHMVAEHWAEMDASGMFSRLLKEDARLIGGALFRVWARSDPKAAMRAILKLGNASGSSRIRNHKSAAFAGWVSVDPEAALSSDWVVENSMELQTPETWAWVRDDPRQALEWLLAAPDSGARQRGLMAVAAEDPEAVLAQVGNLDPKARRAMLDTVFRNWGARDFDTAMRWADEKLFGSARTAAISGLYNYRAHTDPASAALLLDELGGGALRRNLAGLLTYSWAKKDPRAAIVWAKSESDPSVARHVERNWAQRDPQGIADWVLETGVDNVAAETLSEIPVELAMHDVTGAIDWAARLPAEHRGAAMSEIASGGIQAVYQVRAQLDNVPPGEGRERLLGVMGRNFSAIEPEAAKRWIDSLSQEDQIAARRHVRKK